MIKKNNCKFAKGSDGFCCSNKKIKRSFFGIGPRYCIEMFPKYKWDETKGRRVRQESICPFKESKKKTAGPPPKAHPNKK